MKKVIASVLTIVLSIPLFVSTPLANTVSQSYTTGYGSYYFTYNNDLDTFLLHLGNLGGVNMKGYCQSLIYEFNDTYSGYLDIHLMSDSIWQNATIITENCYVKGKNSAQHDYSIGFKNVTSIKVTVVLPTLTTNNAWSGNKMALTTNYNITRDITSIEDNLEDIETTLGNIETTLGNIDAQTATMTSSLSQLLTVEQASRSLLAELEQTIRGDNSLYVLADDMGNIIDNLVDINALIESIHFNEIDYDKNLVIGFQGITSNFSDYTTDMNSYSSSYYYVFNGYNSTLYQNGIYCIRLPINFSRSNSYDFYTWNQGLYNIDDTSIKSYAKPTRMGLYIYFYIDDSETYWFNATNIILKFKNDTYYYKNYIPSDIRYIAPDNEQYFRIKEMIDVNYRHNDILNAIQGVKTAVENMSMNVNQLTVNATGITYNVNNTQVDNSVTTYNTNINQVYNVENNYGTQLDTQLQNYNPDNTSIISRLTASGNIMATVLNGINGIELFTVPISVMLVGIVLLAIVG